MEIQKRPTTVASPYDAQHVTLSNPSWSLWRWSVLRGAGFPADYPLRLASAECATAADQLVQREDDAQTAQQALIAGLNQLMDIDPMQRKALANVIQQARKGKLPIAAGIPDAAQDALATLRLAREGVDIARAEYQRIFNDALIASTEELHALVQLEPFRQALTWQNHQALHTAVAQFLAKPVTTTNSQYRQHRLLLAKYLQRYALKNDTIGFFGPVGWARWGDGPTLQAQPGPQLLAERHVHLESWGINAISQALTRRWPELLPWATPRLVPFARLDQTTLHLPFVKPLPLSVTQARVLAWCDGSRTAQTVARVVVAARLPGVTSEADVYALLKQLLATRRITWSFDVTYEDPYSERALRHQLEQVDLPELRIAALTLLAEVEQSAQAVRQAESVARLDAALTQLEETFTQVTEQASTRSAGQLYAGRTLIYEDCRRDIQVTLGQRFLQGLEQPLELLLTSARWLSYELAQTFIRHCHDVYAELAQKLGTQQVPFTQFFPWVNALLKESPQTIIDGPQRSFQERWAQIFTFPAGQSRVRYASAALAPRVRDLFAAPGAAWPLGHYHCPDVMVAATDAAAINRGDFQYALGELHLGINTFDAPLFMLQHPQPADLFHAIAQDLPEPRVVPVFSQEFFPATRTHQLFAQSKDYRLVTVPEVCDAPPERTLRSGDLMVVEHDGALVIRSYDGRRQFGLMQVLGDYFSLAVGDCFALLSPAPHTPRITIDDVIVARETWRFATAAVAFASMTDAGASYVAVRQWARLHGLPRFLFYRTPKEKKPCFLDLASPLYVELFVKEVRRSANDAADGFIVSLSEMVPDPEHLWLVDAQGDHYASELRIAAVDRME